jgi:dTDP-4-amino-4,6-dideoxygalactose transaminase
MAINVLKPKYHTEEILEEIKKCLDSGWTGMGNRTEEFERAWVHYTGLNNAHFINSATSGLHLAVAVFKNHYGWEDGDEVITTPLTFISTNHAILYERLTPVFCDVDDQLCLDPTKLEDLITPKTKAVMFVGVGGNVGQYSKVVELCTKHNLKLILDASHMAGTKARRGYDGVAYVDAQVGWDADAVVFSFQAVKNLPTADSGMICFKESVHDKLARQLSWLGIDKDTFSRTTNKGSYKWDYDVPNVGFKYNGNSIMAAIAIGQLQYLDQDNAYRNELASLYLKELEGLEKIQIVKHNSTCNSARHLFQILVPEREPLLQYFYDNDIYPGVHYKNNKQYPMYENAKGDVPRAEDYSNRLVSLPLHLSLTTDDVLTVVNLLKAYYE